MTYEELMAIPEVEWCEVIIQENGRKKIVPKRNGRVMNLDAGDMLFRISDTEAWWVGDFDGVRKRVFAG